jgi:hypothetical protein
MYALAESKSRRSGHRFGDKGFLNILKWRNASSAGCFHLVGKRASRALFGDLNDLVCFRAAAREKDL